MSGVVAPERELFISTARSFLNKEGTLARVRELHAKGASFGRDWWQRAAAIGWAGLLVPEDLGGGSVSGDGLADLAVIAEHVGHTVAAGPLHPVNTVLSGLVDAFDQGALADVHKSTIQSMVSGKTVGSWAVYEPGLGWSPQNPTAVAIPTTGGFSIRGVKDRVEAGSDCDVFLVVARCDGAPRQFLVPASAPGLHLTNQESIDLVKRYVRVELNNVDVGIDAVVGSADQTSALVARQAQIAQILQCAEVLGVLETVVTMTMAWAVDRHSFGRPLASYQAIKHRFADMKIWLESCRATASAAIAAVGARAPEAELLTGVAKSYIGEHAAQMVQHCIQLHGGIGVTWEHDLHLFLRRVTLYRSMFGTPEDHSLNVFECTEKTESGAAQ